VKFYRATPQSTIPAGHGADAGAGGAGAPTGGLPGALVVAVRLADLVCPAGPAAVAGRTALVVAGTPHIRAGEQLAFLKVIAVAPAVVRRDGKVQAGGHPADHARLGALEQHLDDLAGPGVIDEIAAQATLGGKVKGRARRSMTAAAAIRATIPQPRLSSEASVQTQARVVLWLACTPQARADGGSGIAVISSALRTSSSCSPRGPARTVPSCASTSPKALATARAATAVASGISSSA